MIALTLRESNGKAAVADKYGEGYGEYEAEVLEACLQYCDKGQLLSFILSSARSELSPVRRDALSLLGDIADRGFSARQRDVVDSALFAAAADRTSWFIRSAAVNALGARAHRDRNLASVARARIHETVVAASTSDPESEVRLSAILQLGEIGDATDIPLLTRIAAEDSSQAVRGGRTVYPLREEARRALARLRAR
ncbi:MAG TPA: HEAT repeat domain-containing protein [Gemmatimonadaceae bacterium]|nr:HEAT repeat domain-containing protein [Gemmatimonadaceae bacterium]